MTKAILHVNSMKSDEMEVYRATILMFLYFQAMLNSVEKRDTIEFAIGIGPLEFAWAVSVVR